MNHTRYELYQQFSKSHVEFEPLLSVCGGEGTVAMESPVLYPAGDEGAF